MARGISPRPLLRASNLNLFVIMDQVVEMMVWVLTPAFFIAGAIFLIYVYKCEDEKED